MNAKSIHTKAWTAGAALLAVAAFLAAGAFAAAEEPAASCCGGKAAATAAATATTDDAMSCGMECCQSVATQAEETVMAQRGPRGGRGGGAMGPNHPLMRDAHTLVFNNGSITREVHEIPNGVRTVTTTTDPNLLQILKRHPSDMKKHLDQGGMVRRWDPLFAELAQYTDKVDMKYKAIENGLEVTSTSKDPEVVKLIRAHAYKVSEFVKRGRAAMHEATPLPEDYRRPKDDAPRQEAHEH